MGRRRTGLVVLSVLLLVLVACGKNYYPTATLPPFFADSYHGECKPETGRTGKLLGDGKIILSSFNDTIRVVHVNAHYNCCADIKMEVKKTGYGFDLFEKDEGFECDCTCDSDVTTFIYGLSAGTYLVKVFDLEGNYMDQGYVIVRPKDPDGPSG